MMSAGGNAFGLGCRLEKRHSSKPVERLVLHLIAMSGNLHVKLQPQNSVISVVLAAHAECWRSGFPAARPEGSTSSK